MKSYLLKLSGEVLGGRSGTGLDGEALGRVCDEIVSGLGEGDSLGIVVGAGNFLRGRSIRSLGIPRTRGDVMGMFATVLNGLALQAALETRGREAVVLSAFEVGLGVERYSEDALRKARGKVAVFVGGTGNPFLTTDTAAAIRAAQMGADVLLKGTKVDGVYTSDPEKDARAERFDRLSLQEVLRRSLKVMDLTAITLCMENRIPVRVFNVRTPGNLAKALRGEELGTYVVPE